MKLLVLRHFGKKAHFMENREIAQFYTFSVPFAEVEALFGQNTLIIKVKVSTDGSDEDLSVPRSTLSFPIVQFHPFRTDIVKLAMNYRLIGLGPSYS